MAVQTLQRPPVKKPRPERNRCADAHLRAFCLYRIKGIFTRDRQFKNKKNSRRRRLLRLWQEEVEVSEESEEEEAAEAAAGGAVWMSRMSSLLLVLVGVSLTHNANLC